MLPPPQASGDPYDVPESPFKPKDTPVASQSKENGVMAPSQAHREGTTTPRRTPRGTPRRVLAKEPIADDVGSAKKANFEIETADTTEYADEADGPEEPSTLTVGEGVSRLGDQADNPELEIEALTSHRVDKDAATVDFLVAWEGGETSWESEFDLQFQAPNVVFEYWDKLESREDATGLDIYHVFKILKRIYPAKGKQSKYLIQWVGYRRKESTWEPESKVKEMAPEALKAFEAKHGAVTGGSTAQKRSSGRGPGRPRKRAKPSANGAD